MLVPPSLSPVVLGRAFHARNGEIAVLPSDANAFLDACKKDGVAVLGWELWLINHDWGIRSAEPTPAPGFWCGLMPVRSSHLPAVVHGSGDLERCQNQIGELDLDGMIPPRWLQFVRVNFTL